jgi:hypothetical protein
MTAIDSFLEDVFKELGIKRYPCIIQDDSRILLKEFGAEKVGCITETIAFTEQLENGLLRIHSILYFISPLKDDSDILQELNPKILNIAVTIYKFKLKMKECPFGSVHYPVSKSPSLRFKTTANECGIELVATFDIDPRCL